MKTISVVISGRGSNLEALLNAVQAGHLKARVARVIANRADAGGLAIAAQHGVPTTVIESKKYQDRAAFDAALAMALDADQPDLIVLAGFMRILGESIVKQFNHRMINIHPALLPSYPGVDTHQRALADGVKWHGCTVHFVTPKVDVGPIIGQSVVPVREGDTEAILAARVLKAEHRLLVDCVRWFCEERLVIKDDKVLLRNAETSFDAYQNPVG
ncbi:MAG: phosphoribosylglycinamide formyltransferase [Burkholderiales bacterium]|nr:phosphoribosylglycinamide formyltransferase [Burkholderiales bacterium]